MSIVLQKAVTPQLSTAYVERGLDRVFGYVVPAADVAGITTTAGLFELHGLGFSGTPFAPEKPIDVLHLPTPPTAGLVRATGGNDDAGRQATDGPILDRPPFTGTGLATVEDVITPLSWLEHTRLTPGTRLWRFSPGAEEPELVGTYHGVAFGWQNHLDGDSFHAVLPSKYVGPLARTADGTFAADVRTGDDGRPAVVTVVTAAPDAEQHGFARTSAGMWAKQLAPTEVSELFEIHATARWHGILVRIVDQGPDSEGVQRCRISSLANDADVAEKNLMDKIDPGVYEATVALADLMDVNYTQRIPTAWAKAEQVQRARAAAAASGGAGTARPPDQGIGAPVVSVGAGGAATASTDQRAARQSALLQRVAQGIVKAAPPGWARARLLCRIVGTQAEVLAAATPAGGEEQVLPGVPEDVGAALAELRHVTFEPGLGAWYTALVTVESTGKVTLNFDRSNEPRWTKPVPASMFAQDVARYPRDEEHTPEWLRDRLAEAGTSSAG
ncbi:MAG: hypothetical protein ACYC1Z_10385 [Georgenia sp.]